LPSAVRSTASVVTLFIACFLSACAAWTPGIPTVRDEKLELFVAAEALRILGVSENARKAALYEFHLVNFPRRDILGLSIGNQQIFINYELTRLAYEKESYRWLFRQTLAHEIAHDVLGKKQSKRRENLEPARGLANSITGSDLGLTGNAPFYSYSQVSELEADRKEMEY
jgi:predicted Zn-dependent protease